MMPKGKHGKSPMQNSNRGDGALERVVRGFSTGVAFLCGLKKFHSGPMPASGQKPVARLDKAPNYSPGALAMQAHKKMMRKLNQEEVSDIPQR